MRLFFAVDMPSLPPWDPETGAGVRGPASAPIHLTIRFLGERPESMLADLKRAGESAVDGMSAFPVDLRAIGAFPSAHSPRVVWLGVGTGRGELATVERKLSQALLPLGIPLETREFFPHVTWRRIRSRNDVDRARRWLAMGELPSAISGRVGSLVLKESELSSEGAHHRVVAEFPLGSVATP